MNSTKRINLVSLKNIDIWPRYGPKNNNHWFWVLFAIFDFWALKEGVAPHESGASNPDLKVDPLGGPFGSPVISKSCFQLL